MQKPLENTPMENWKLRATRICENIQICDSRGFRFHQNNEENLRISCLNDSIIRETEQCKQNKLNERVRSWYYSEEFLVVEQPEIEHICGIGIYTSLIGQTKGLIRLKLTVCPSSNSSASVKFSTVVGNNNSTYMRINWPVKYNPNVVGLNDRHGWIVGAGLYVDSNLLSLKVSTRLFPGKFKCNF